jgi:hypothetical protein
VAFAPAGTVHDELFFYTLAAEHLAAAPAFAIVLAWHMLTVAAYRNPSLFPTAVAFVPIDCAFLAYSCVAFFA